MCKILIYHGHINRAFTVVKYLRREPDHIFENSGPLRKKCKLIVSAEAGHIKKIFYVTKN